MLVMRMNLLWGFVWMGWTTREVTHGFQGRLVGLRVFRRGTCTMTIGARKGNFSGKTAMEAGVDGRGKYLILLL